jgi:hypothetical protein
MAQLIYSISALGIAMVFAISIQSKSNAGEQAVYQNEVLTQLVAAGRDIVDDITQRDLPFDRWVDPDRLPVPSYYPYVHSADGLTAEDDFGGCVDFDACLDIDDFDDMTGIAGSRGGIDFEASIQVHYVAEEDPAAPVAGNTFAKEIVVTVESDAIQVFGESVAATYRRVITYPRITQYSY